jgi:hypothetical protein
VILDSVILKQVGSKEEVKEHKERRRHEITTQIKETTFLAQISLILYFLTLINGLKQWLLMGPSISLLSSLPLSLPLHPLPSPSLSPLSLPLPSSPHIHV